MRVIRLRYTEAISYQNNVYLGYLNIPSGLYQEKIDLLSSIILIQQDECVRQYFYI